MNAVPDVRSSLVAALSPRPTVEAILCQRPPATNGGGSSGSGSGATTEVVVVVVIIVIVASVSVAAALIIWRVKRTQIKPFKGEHNDGFIQFMHVCSMSSLHFNDCICHIYLKALL